MRPLVLGVAGTAKNTGKTTTIIELMKAIKKNPDITLALTSIGYDGEPTDSITGLPKPRIFVWRGMLVAVAEKCIQESNARIEILMKTEISTPLGKIIIGRVMQKGMLVIAGPNKSKDLRYIVEVLKEKGAILTIVDGALNRIAPLVEANGLVLATGAARTAQIRQLVDEMRMMTEIFQIPDIKIDTSACFYNNVLETSKVTEIIECLKHHKTAVIDGIIGQECLELLAQKSIELKGDTTEKHIVFPDPIKLILSGRIEKTNKALQIFAREHINIRVLKRVKIAAVTVNPYYPLYRSNSSDYEEAYIDKYSLYNTMKEVIKVPVYDLVQEGPAGLFQDIMNIAAD